MILSISNIAWHPSNRLSIYSALQKFNFTGLEIAPGLLFNHADNPFNPLESELNKIIDELNNFNLKIVSMQSLLFGKKDALLFGNSDQRQIFFDGMLEAIKLAERLNVPNLVFGSPSNRNISKGMKLIDAQDIARSTFTKLGEVALNAGTSISIEPNPQEYGTNFINNMNQAISFIKKIESPGIKAILDIGSIKMNNEFDDLPNLISKSIAHLNHVHISEPYLMPAPQSFSEYEYLYNLLLKAGYEKALSIEMKSENISINNIEACLSKMSRINTH